MHVELHPRFTHSSAGQRAKDLTGACVHCGFCLETCPTYLDTRDERDSPRGRIYLIKQLLENGEASEPTRTHLDRCLTCRSCETTCPSGMEYGQLLDIGRDLMEEEAPRNTPDKVLRSLLRFVFSRPRLLGAGLWLGQVVRPLLPPVLRQKVPPRQKRRPLPAATHPRKMLLLEGCVQSAATPNTNDAARRVLSQLGISLVSAPKAGCCGALDYHLAAHNAGLAAIRRNIDAWWPHIESGAEAIISSATGCGAMLVDYGRLLAHDPAYANKAQRVSALCRDLGEVLLREDLNKLQIDTGIGKVAVHTPCSLQHALQQPTLIEDILGRAGFELAQTRNKHLCCGSAGSYSILQPATSSRLRKRAITSLTGDQPTLIATGNIGCQLHLQSADAVPVRHWIELLDSD